MSWRQRAAPVLVDFFQTLVEVDCDVPRSWQLLTGFGYPSAPEVEAVWSPDGFDGAETPSGEDYHTWHEWLLAEHARTAGVPAPRLATMVRRLQENDRAWTVRATRDALSFLTALSSSCHRVVICTNWDYDLRPYLRQAGLPTAIPVALSWQHGVRKPNTKLFWRALELADVSVPTEATMVGDSFACDVVGALRASLNPIWIGGSDQHPLVGADQVVVAASLSVAASRIR